MLVRVRLVADTHSELEEVIAYFQATFSNRVSGFQSIQPGRCSGFIAYRELLSSPAARWVKVMPVDPTPAKLHRLLGLDT